MSYDLAVWEGELPADDGAAGEAYDQLYALYMEGEELPPTPRIRAYVLAVLERWVEMTDDEHDVSPWSAGPLMDEVSGPFVYFTMRYSMCEEVSAEAGSHGGKPRAGLLRPAVGTPSPDHRRVRRRVPVRVGDDGQRRSALDVAARTSDCC
ncbi:hypothetical protein [Micromonospora sp. ANENR4]|uniref:hypothetical protein n=1 Tax=Micromonospora sp. ANENR4 TaxID=2783662 RepID=UPI001E2FB36E|nr:hypothetical protein [Micromonospora sp. ANENR4]